MSCFADPVIYFMPGQLSAFTRLGALRHFYLQFICFGEIITGYTKPRRSNLFDSRTHRIAIGQFS
jgi:hypothetical protein